MSDTLGYERNALRDLGIDENDLSSSEKAELSACASEIIEILRPRFEQKSFDIDKKDGRVIIKGCDYQLPGTKVFQHFYYCDRIIIFVATLGAEVDSMISTLEKTDISRSVIMDSIANSALEAFCDSIESQLSEVYTNAFTSRIAPGDGDIPYELQTDLMALLDAQRKIGITYDEEHNIFTPHKSKIEMIGLK